MDLVVMNSGVPQVVPTPGADIHWTREQYEHLCHRPFFFFFFLLCLPPICIFQFWPLISISMYYHFLSLPKALSYYMYLRWLLQDYRSNTFPPFQVTAHAVKFCKDWTNPHSGTPRNSEISKTSKLWLVNDGVQRREIVYCGGQVEGTQLSRSYSSIDV